MEHDLRQYLLPAPTSILDGDDASLFSYYEGPFHAFENALLDEHGVKDDVAALLQLVNEGDVVAEVGAGTGRAIGNDDQISQRVTARFASGRLGTRRFQAVQAGLPD